MPRAKSTVCRYCRQPGALYHGAHKVCFSKDQRDRIRVKRGMNPEKFWAADSDNCADCDQKRKGKSLRCEPCQVKHRARMDQEQKQRDRQYLPERKCECGCGVVFRAKRDLYATPECREKHRERAKAQRKRRDPSTYSTPSLVVKQTLCARIMTPKQEEPIGEFINHGIAVTKVPPVLRPSLRNMFGDERGETWLATDW